MKVKYSFITPRKKVTLDSFTLYSIIFLSIISMSFLLLGFYLKYTNSNFQNIEKNYQTKIEEIKKEKKKINKDINEYLQIVNLEKKAKKANIALKNGLKNFFVLIPDQIKINKLYLTKYEVKIYGETDNPQTYKLLVEPPLKSIFDNTKVGFTKISDNRYKFSSYNQIKGVKHEE